MRTSRTFVILVGVALSAAPIFSWAQQSNQQVNTVMELQSLRAEIAELRDMVERQQYQLQKMQRAAQGGSATVHQSQIANSGYQNKSPNSYSEPFSQPAVTGTGIVANSSPASGNSVGTSSVGTSSVSGSMPTQVIDTHSGENSSSNEDLAPAFVNDQVDFYRPESDEGSAEVSAIDGVVIEERQINPIGPGYRQDSVSYPPVEERTIEQRGAYPAQQATVQQSNTAQAVATPGAAGQIRQPQVLQQHHNSPLTQAARVGTGGVQQQANSVPVTTSSIVPATGLPNQQTRLPNQQVTGVIAVPNNAAAGNTVYNGTVPPTPTSTGTVQNPIYQQPGQVLPNQNNSQIRDQQTAKAIPAVIGEQDYYQQGFELLKQSKHDQAVSVFKQQIANYPQGNYVDDAHYWIAESMYVNRSLDESKKYFKAIIDHYEQSPRLPDAMLKTAYIEQEQGNMIEARILLQEIIQYHPRSNAAISAKNRLAELN